MQFQAKTEIFILGCPQDDGNVAVLCRNGGNNPGPATCSSKRDAIKLKTLLLNDPRGMENHRAIDIIKSLLVYKVGDSNDIIWEGDTLWAHIKADQVKCAESNSFWS